METAHHQRDRAAIAGTDDPDGKQIPRIDAAQIRRIPRTPAAQRPRRETPCAAVTTRSCRPPAPGNRESRASRGRAATLPAHGCGRSRFASSPSSISSAAPSRRERSAVPLHACWLVNASARWPRRASRTPRSASSVTLNASQPPSLAQRSRCGSGCSSRRAGTGSSSARAPAAAARTAPHTRRRTGRSAHSHAHSLARVRLGGRRGQGRRGSGPLRAATDPRPEHPRRRRRRRDSPRASGSA